LYCTKQKVLSFLEGADLLRDWKEDAAGRQSTTTATISVFQLAD
jgi:hypothetical protein